MAVTKKFLVALGIEPDKADEIMTAHAETIEGLKAKIEESKGAAEQLAAVTAELEAAKKSLAEAEQKLADADKADYKGKYEAEKAAREKLESDVAAKETAAKKEAALTAAAKKAKYSDDAIAMILDSKRDYAGRIEFDKEGKPTNIDAILGEIATDRPSLTPKVTETHHTPATPPANNGAGKPTKDEIMAIRNTADRQRAIAENPELFGLPAHPAGDI